MGYVVRRLRFYLQRSCKRRCYGFNGDRMPFPNDSNKFQGEAVMQPADTIAMRRRFGQFPKIDPPEGLILCMKNGLPEKLKWRVPVQKVGRVMGDLHLVKRTRGR